MRKAAKYASLIAFASVACVMSAQEQPKQPTAQGVNFYSVEREAQAGAEAAAQIERAVTVMRSQALDSYFEQLVGERMFRIVVFHQPVDKVDAGQPAMPADGFANPGREPVALPGTIFVNDRMLVDAMDEVELAKKIAHAMAHVSLRHAAKLATKAEIAGYAQLPMVFTGGGWAAYGIRQSAQVQVALGFQRFTKQYEAEAEQASAEILKSLNLDAASFAKAQAAVR